MTATLPTAGPHRSRNVIARAFTEADVPEMARILLDERVYQQGYVMFERPTTAAAAEKIARGYLNDGHDRDGAGNGRLTYAFELTEDSRHGEAGRVVGSSSLGEVHLARQSAHLGWTLYHPDVWGTGLNPEAKWLLLRHAFEECGMGRVKIQTDSRNTRSQAAIAKLGATREGVLRREQPRGDGSWRDTVVFSILADEWPQVAVGLRRRFKA